MTSTRYHRALADGRAPVGLFCCLDGFSLQHIFAAAFGPEQPVASNADAEGRSRNRRVEMAPVPKSAKGSVGADE